MRLSARVAALSLGVIASSVLITPATASVTAAPVSVQDSESCWNEGSPNVYRCRLRTANGIVDLAFQSGQVRGSAVRDNAGSPPVHLERTQFVGGPIDRIGVGSRGVTPLVATGDHKWRTCADFGGYVCTGWHRDQR